MTYSSFPSPLIEPAVSQIFMVLLTFPQVTVFIKKEAPMVVEQCSLKRPRTNRIDRHVFPTSTPYEPKNGTHPEDR